MKNSLATIILVSCALYARAQTNALWLQTTVPPTNILSPRQVCDLIETESAKLDPAGQGLKVIFNPGFDKWGKAELTFSPSPLSFFDMLDLVASTYSKSAKVFDNVGVIPWIEYRDVYTAIEGQCVDALTGEPITDFRINDGSPFIAIQTNGYFVCGIRQALTFSKCSTATFAEHDISDLQREITVTAPGYIPLVITNYVYRHGPMLNIRLERATKRNEGEQSVPGYPPQGVGSPEP